MYPKYLYRSDDGMRFTLQGNGYYSMDYSEMNPKYGYSYETLIKSGFVEEISQTVQEKVKLNFMVCPEQLAKWAYVPNAIKCRVIDSHALLLTGILGESGMRLARAKLEFYFTEDLANKLIEKRIVVAV